MRIVDPGFASQTSSSSAGAGRHLLLRRFRRDGLGRSARLQRGLFGPPAVALNSRGSLRTFDSCEPGGSMGPTVRQKDRNERSAETERPHPIARDLAIVPSDEMEDICRPCFHDFLGRFLMPNRCMREIRVVRGKPSRAAAPSWPPSFQFVSSRTR